MTSILSRVEEILGFDIQSNFFKTFYGLDFLQLLDPFAITLKVDFFLEGSLINEFPRLMIPVQFHLNTQHCFDAALYTFFLILVVGNF